MYLQFIMSSPQANWKCSPSCMMNSRQQIMHSLFNFMIKLTEFLCCHQRKEPTIESLVKDRHVNVLVQNLDLLVNFSESVDIEVLQYDERNDFRRGTSLSNCSMLSLMLSRLCLMFRSAPGATCFLKNS